MGSKSLPYSLSLGWLLVTFSTMAPVLMVASRLCLILGLLALDNSSLSVHLCPFTGPASVLQHAMVRVTLTNTALKWREKTSPCPRYTHFLGCEQKGYTVQLQHNYSALSLLTFLFSLFFLFNAHIISYLGKRKLEFAR